MSAAFQLAGARDDQKRPVVADLQAGADGDRDAPGGQDIAGTGRGPAAPSGRAAASPAGGAEPGDRRVLQVGIHQHDHVAARLLEPGGERRLLAEVARQLQAADARHGQPGPQRGERRVGAAVVDDHDLPREAQRVELGAERAQQRIEVAGLQVVGDEGRVRVAVHPVGVHGAFQQLLSMSPPMRLPLSFGRLSRTPLHGPQGARKVTFPNLLTVC